MSFVGVLVVLGLAFMVAAVLDNVTSKNDPAEPPRVNARIPFIGHFLGLMRHGVSFYAVLREKTKMSIYTISLLGGKIYVITSPHLVAQVNRKQKIISNNGPFTETVFKRMLGIDAEGMELLRKNPDSTGSLRKDMHDAEHHLLKPDEPTMRQAYCNTMAEIARRLETVAIGETATVDLMSWVKGIFTLSTASALYGPNNPFAVTPTLLEDFWTYDDGLKMLVLDMYPAITAPATVKARQRLVDGFKDYYQHVDDNEISSFVQQRTGVARKYKCSKDHVARYELGLLSGLLLNTVPAIFWLLGHIAEDRLLLARIRAEIPSIVEREPKSGTLQVNVAAVKARCPLLHSTFQETLRVVGSGIGTMLVLEDTLLDGRWLLKKDAVVQIPATAIHTDPAVWGPDAGRFDAERFVKGDGHHTPKETGAFRTFGGGATLCPGRHLAHDEILAFAAVVLYTFDIRFSTKTPELPAKDTTNLGSVMKPKAPLEVLLARRPLAAKARWDFSQAGPWGLLHL